MLINAELKRMQLSGKEFRLVKDQSMKKIRLNNNLEWKKINIFNSKKLYKLKSIVT